MNLISFYSIKILGRCSKRKGFMHALEGIIAAIVLFFYFSSASLPPLQKNDWTYNSVKQTGTEYLNSIERSDASQMLAEDSKVLSKITNSLFETSDISIMNVGSPPKDIVVGLLGKSGNSTIVLGGVQEPYDGWCTSNGWYPADTLYRSDCIVNNTNGLNNRTVLADLNGDDFYDAVYVDLDNDNIYDANPSEGPFFAGGYAAIGGSNYYIKYIDSDDESIKFVNVTSFDYFKNSQNTTINGRSTRFVYYVADMASDISQYDVILITDSIDLTLYLPKLKSFLLSGKGIVEIINMTAGNYNLEQSDLFGLERTDYDIIETSNIVHLSENLRSISEPLKIKDYFLGIPLRINMVVFNNPPYDVSGLPNSVSVRVGFINLTAGSTGIAISNNSGVYDSLYVDSNGDYNFSKPPEDATPYIAGSMFNTSSGNYTVKAFDSRGKYIEVRPSDNAYLSNFFNPLKIAPNENSWASAEQNNLYNISNNTIGSSFTITLSNLPQLGDSSTLPAGTYRFGAITQSYSNIMGAMYNISTTNVSGALFLNIDFNKDLKYNGAGEGPFANGEIFGIGPENYRIDITSEGLVVKFTLYSRDYVPVVIAGNKYTGRTVWMPDVTDGGMDSWNYISAALVWAAPKNNDPYKSSAYHNIISSKKVFIRGGDVFQPYVVEFSRRYQ